MQIHSYTSSCFCLLSSSFLSCTVRTNTNQDSTSHNDLSFQKKSPFLPYTEPPPPVYRLYHCDIPVIPPQRYSVEGAGAMLIFSMSFQLPEGIL